MEAFATKFGSVSFVSLSYRKQSLLKQHLRNGDIRSRSTLMSFKYSILGSSNRSYLSIELASQEKVHEEIVLWKNQRRLRHAKQPMKIKANPWTEKTNHLKFHPYSRRYKKHQE